MAGDLIHNYKVLPAINPVQTSAATAIVGAIIDRANYERVLFAIALGALTATALTGTVLLEEGDDPALADAAAVADSDMVGATPEVTAGFTQADDNVVKVLEYHGMRRYVRVTITPTSNNAAASLAVVAILKGARYRPV